MLRTFANGLSISVLAASLVLLAACSHPKPVVAPEIPERRPAPSPAPSAGGTTEVKSEPTISPAQTPESGVAAGELPADLALLNKAGYLKDGFFDTDKANLRQDTRGVLASDAAWLKAHPSIKILIEGHCDERNTEEYNLALGWRRCNAAKDYLVALGVAPARISTISYGKEKPFATCHDESCWWQNRRAHFVITGR